MSIPVMRFPVTVIMQRTPLENRWASERWEPVAVVPHADEAPEGTPPERIRDDATCTQWRFDGHRIELHPSEAEGYHLNLDAPEPKAFVGWRTREEPADPPVYPAIVTVSYNEAARMMDGGERVDAVPLPELLRQWMVAFVADHYRPEPKRKVRRNDPFAENALRRGRGGGR